MMGEWVPTTPLTTETIWILVESGPNVCDNCDNTLDEGEHLFVSEICSTFLLCRECKTAENIGMADDDWRQE